MKKLILGITAPSSIVLIQGQLKYFREKGFDTYLMAPQESRVEDFCVSEGCTLLPIKIEREISPFKDIASLWKIYKYYRRIKPDIINVGTPKMGLLGIIAGKCAGTKKRIYTCRGFRFEHESGSLKRILVLMEKITGLWAHKIICISPSVKNLGIKLNIFPEYKTVVISNGSSNGIDSVRFSPNAINKSELKELKIELGIGDKFIFGFVGRLIDRKGILELYNVFTSLSSNYHNMKLLIVGPIETKQILQKELIEKMKNHPDILLVGRQENVPLYLSAMDVFVLPAWWEGFGNVLVQAAAMGIPVISTKATGSIDAVKEGFNGILIEPKSEEQLSKAMLSLYQEHETRTYLGKNGISWAKKFDNIIIWEGMLSIYNSL